MYVQVRLAFIWLAGVNEGGDARGWIAVARAMISKLEWRKGISSARGRAALEAMQWSSKVSQGFEPSLK